MPFALTPKLAATIANRMSEVATTHPNDQLANQYSRTAERLEVFGEPFADPLETIDILTIKVFIKNYMT